MAEGQAERKETAEEEAQTVARFQSPTSGAALWREKARRCKRKLSFYCSEEEAYGAHFLLAPLFLAAGIIVYFSLSFEPEWALLGAAALLCGGLVYLFRRCRPLRLSAGFALLACCGALCAKSETMRFATPMLGGNRAAPLAVRILTLEKSAKSGYRLTAETIPAYGKALGNKTFRLRLAAAKLPEGANLGSVLQGLVFLRSFSGPVRPHSYDFAFQNYFRGIGGQGNFAGMPKLLTLPPNSLPDSWFARAGSKLTALRARMTERIKAAIGGERGAVAAALIVGERAGIAPATNQALRLAGLAHILSISGLHMAMAAGMVLLAVRKILGLFPVFSSRRAAKKVAACFAFVSAAFYLALSGADIAAQRSFIMIAVMLGAVLCDRAAVSLRNLAISALIIMLWRPHEIMGPSFQMSFAATAALIAAFDAWSLYRRKSRTERGAAKFAPYRPGAGFAAQMRFAARRWIAAPAVSTCAASLIAGAAGGVYSAYHFNNTAPFGIIGNVLALPIMAVLVMPFALLGTLLMPLHLESLPLRIMGYGISGVENVAYWVASFSPPGNPGIVPPAALICLTAGMALLIMLRTKLRLAACALIGLGLGIYALTPAPLAVIAENGRLAAVYGADKILYLNSARPSAFIAQIWQISYAAKGIRPPRGVAEAAADGFTCAEDYCRAFLRNGAILITAERPESQAAACRAGDIIVLNFIDVKQKPEIAAACAGKQLITMRDLALFGAAEIRPAGFWFWRRQGQAAEINWAAGRPARPWNSYRRYFKRARNMPS